MSPLALAITSAATAITAIVAVFITYVLTKKREHASDWRKLKLEQYQEFVLALSGVVRERATPDAQRRYADAVNSMMLVAPAAVLERLKAFQDEISYVNKGRSQERHDQLLEELFRAMRRDVHPAKLEDSAFPFRLLGLPPPSES
ncbi:MAG: hypothetical protein AAB403_12900 [Planctomycetota bacterium]